MSDRSEEAELPRSLICALTAELSVAIAEKPWDFFDHTDLLDFPGARSRLKLANLADVAKAKGAAQKEREALLAKAHEEQEQLLERARREIAAERDKAIVALRQEAVDLSIAAASKLVEANLDSDANRKLVTEYLAGLDKK